MMMVMVVGTPLSAMSLGLEHLQQQQLLLLLCSMVFSCLPFFCPAASPVTSALLVEVLLYSSVDMESKHALRAAVAVNG